MDQLPQASRAKLESKSLSYPKTCKFHYSSPISSAERNHVGVARKEPNHSPFLPPPVGRLNLSLNPFKMLSQFVGPA